MSYPTQPSLTVSPLSTSSFRASVSGADPGTSNRLFYEQLDARGQAVFPSTGPVVPGNGSADVTGLTPLAHYQVWVVSDNGSSYSLPSIAFVSLCQPSTLLQAVKDRWYSTPALTSLVTGGLYLSQVPDTKDTSRIDLPYATCDSERTRFEWTQTRLFYEITTLEFNAYVAGSAANLEQTVSEIRSAFDWATLTFADGVTTSTYVQPLSFDYAAEPVRYRDDSLVYRACVRYEAWINRTFSPYS